MSSYVVQVVDPADRVLFAFTQSYRGALDEFIIFAKELVEGQSVEILDLTDTVLLGWHNAYNAPSYSYGAACYNVPKQYDKSNMHSIIKFMLDYEDSLNEENQ